jgi:hypothetical protein
VGSFKNLLRNHRTRNAEIYMKAFLDSTKASLLKSWLPGVGWGHNRVNYFYMCLHRKNIFKISFSRTTGPKGINFT